MVNVLPDNKIVEDCHNGMKADAKKTGRSGKRTNLTLQDSLMNSKVFQSRNIRHAPEVQRQYFLNHYKGTKVSPKFARRYRAKNHKLPAEWRKITNKKTWQTFSEDTFRKDVAAWVWMQEGHPALAPTQGITLDAALFSKLCMPRMALRSKSNNTLYASLGNYVWSAMAWSMRIMSTEPDAWTFQLNPQGSAEFIHVTDPSNWEVLPYESFRSPCPNAGFLLLRQTGPAMSLIKACIQRAGNGLHLQDLLRLARHLGLAFPDNAEHDTVLKAIALHVSDNDENFAELVLQMSKVSLKTMKELTDDPFFELAYDMLNDDDKNEFPDVGEELQKKRVRHRQAHDREERKRRKMAAPRHPPPLPAPGPGGGGPSGPPLPDPAPAPAPAPKPAPAPAHPKAAPLPPRRATPIGPGGTPWGPDFVIAETTRHGEVVAVTVTCNVHKCAGTRCNKWITIGESMDIAAAEHRIKEWCVRGYDIPDDADGVKTHMKASCLSRPRNWKDSDLRPLAQLEEIALRGRVTGS